MTIRSQSRRTLSILCLAGIAAASTACAAPAYPGGLGSASSGESSGESSGDESGDESSGDDEASGGPVPAGDESSESSGADESSGGDSSSDDGPSPTPEPDPEPECVPTHEWCNGIDDDCDDAVDEICPTDGDMVTLTNVYMGDYYGLSAAGTSSPPQMADFDVAGDRARWVVEDLGDGYFRFTSVYYGPEDALDSSTEAPSLGETGPYSGQFWRPIEIEGHCMLMTNMYLGETRSLTNVLDSLQLVMGDDVGYAGQCWTIHSFE